MNKKVIVICDEDLTGNGVHEKFLLSKDRIFEIVEELIDQNEYTNFCLPLLNKNAVLTANYIKELTTTYPSINLQCYKFDSLRFDDDINNVIQELQEGKINVQNVAENNPRDFCLKIMDASDLVFLIYDKKVNNITKIYCDKLKTKFKNNYLLYL